MGVSFVFRRASELKHVAQEIVQCLTEYTVDQRWGSSQKQLASTSRHQQAVGKQLLVALHFVTLAHALLGVRGWLSISAIGAQCFTTLVSQMPALDLISLRSSREGLPAQIRAERLWQDARSG